MSPAARFLPTPTATIRADNAFYLAWDAIARDRDEFPRLDRRARDAIRTGRLCEARLEGRLT